LALDGFLRLSKTVQAWAPFVTLELQVGGQEGRERRREEGGEGRKGRKEKTNKEGKSYEHIFITSSTSNFSFLPAPLPPSLPPLLYTAGGRGRGRAQGPDQANVRVAA